MLNYLIAAVLGAGLPIAVAWVLPNKMLFNFIFFQCKRLVDLSRGKFGAGVVKPVRKAVQNSLRVTGSAIDEGLGFYDRYSNDDVKLLEDPYTYIVKEKGKRNGEGNNNKSSVSRAINPGASLIR